MTTSTVSRTSSPDGSSRVPRRTALKTSRLLLVGGLLAMFAWSTLMVSFAAPYWLSSYQYTYSEFVRMGLWDFCFKEYRHPSYQYDQKFNGCHWVYSSVYQNIRDWLQPGWFILVQAMMAIGFVFSSLSLGCISLTLMYYFVKYQVSTILLAAVLQVLVAIPLFVAVSVFGGMAFDRGWLLNPQFNHLDWGYIVAVCSLFLHVLVAGLLFYETIRVRARRRKLNNLVYNMQPRF